VCHHRGRRSLLHVHWHWHGRRRKASVRMLLHVHGHGHLAWVHRPLHWHMLLLHGRHVMLLLLLLVMHGRHLLWWWCTLLLVFSNDLNVGNGSSLDGPLRPPRTSIREEYIFERQRASCHFSYSAVQDSIRRLLESDFHSRASKVGHDCRSWSSRDALTKRMRDFYADADVMWEVL
jgi:hypothetical protein